MRRIAALCGIALAFVGPAVAAADDLPASQLVAEAESFDGVTISVRGELVGDFLRRRGVVWVQLNDDAYVDAPLRGGGSLAGGNLGIGVRIPDTVFAVVADQHPGGYRWRGPVVRVTGIWRHHDPARGGESYLDATGMVLLEGSRPIGDTVHLWGFVVGGLLLVGGGLSMWRRRRRP